MSHLFGLLLGLASAACVHQSPIDAVAKLTEVLPNPPCTSPSKDKPIDLVLIGENHFTDVARRIRETGVARATRGELAFFTEVGTDGALFSTDVPPTSPANGLAGLDSSVPLTVVLAYTVRNQLGLRDAAQAQRLIAKFVNRSPMLGDAVRAARRESADPSAFDAALDGVTPNSSAALGKVVDHVLDLAGTKYAAQLDGQPFPDIPSLFTREYTAANARLMKIRDRDFSRSIGRAICGLAGRFDRVFVNVGDDHVAGVREQIERDLGSAIKVRYLNPFEKGEAEEALRLLKE